MKELYKRSALWNAVKNERESGYVGMCPTTGNHKKKIEMFTMLKMKEMEKNIEKK